MVRGFYPGSAVVEAAAASVPAVAAHRPAVGAANGPELTARVAVYDDLTAPPRVEDVCAHDPRSFIEALASTTYDLARRAGGSIPYVVLREIAENLIHADFREAVVTISDNGNTVRFSDHGPGIPDKERAVLPGFSTATGPMKVFIRGVGSGLPVARECLSFTGGTLTIEDNLGCGTVVTLRLGGQGERAAFTAGAEEQRLPALSLRQKQILSLALELGSIGPSLVSKEISVGLSTAHRDLEALEALALLQCDEGGKRRLTPLGETVLARILYGSSDR